MRKISIILIVFSALISSGCQESAQTSPATAERKEKLLAAEIINLKGEIDKTKKQVDKQNKLIEELKQKNEKLQAQAVADANQIKSLRSTISERAKDLTSCNEKLVFQQKKIEECQRMLDLVDIPALCKDRVAKQKKLLEQCRKEKEEIEKAAAESSTFLMEKLPTDLMQQVEKLSTENAELRARIDELEKSLPGSSTPKE